MDKIWLKNYDPGVPHTIDPDQYASIPDMLEECFTKYADDPCFINFGAPLTFKQVDELSQAYAEFLQAQCQLVKGDRVAIMMPNCAEDGIVYPSEVENIISEMIGIKEVIIVKDLSKNKTPIIKACVVKSGFSLLEDISKEMILTHCKRHLADYQVPDEVEFYNELPRSATGFILRYQLRKKST